MLSAMCYMEFAAETRTTGASIVYTLQNFWQAGLPGERLLWAPMGSRTDPAQQAITKARSCTMSMPSASLGLPLCLQQRARPGQVQASAVLLHWPQQ